MISPSSILGVAASVIAVVSTLPYIRDIFLLKTTPHSYSWFVWTILQVTGTLAMISKGAGWGALSTAVGAILCAFVFLLSLRYGTKNVTLFDTVCLIGALVAMSTWFFLHDALLAILLVVATDLTAYLPTFRKGYAEPFSENISLYFFSGVSQVLSLLALSTFTVTTSLYLITLVVTNFIFCVMIWIRRSRIVSGRV